MKIKLTTLLITFLIFFSCKNESENKNTYDAEKQERIKKARKQANDILLLKEKYNPIEFDSLLDKKKSDNLFSYELEDLLINSNSTIFFNGEIEDVERFNDSLYIIHTSIGGRFSDIRFFCRLKTSPKILNKISSNISRHIREYDDISFVAKFLGMKKIDFINDVEIFSNGEDDYDYTSYLDTTKSYIITGECIDAIFSNEYESLKEEL